MTFLPFSAPSLVLPLIFLFLLGTIVGSFLNVVILRLGSGRTVLGRSGCFSCAQTLRWFELIPVVSFLFLRGRCSQCRSKISIQYPVVEIITGGIFAFLFARFFWAGEFEIAGVIAFLLSLTLWSSLIVIFVYDLRHKIIPDGYSLAFSALATALTLFAASSTPGIFGERLVAALVLSLFFFFLWFVSQGRWMGFGDVKLAFGIGMYLGLAVGLSALAYAFWIGAAFSLARIGIGRMGRAAGEGKLLGTKRLSSTALPLTMKSEVPFAPFLIIGMFLAFLLQSDVFHVNFFMHL